MNEDEFKECSVVAYPHEIRFLHIKGGHISYYVDRHVSDYVNKLQEENQKLKADYGNKSQVERDLLKEENKQLKEQLKQKEDIINKLKNQPTVYLTKYLDNLGFVETKTLNELIEELEKE